MKILRRPVDFVRVWDDYRTSSQYGMASFDDIVWASQFFEIESPTKLEQPIICRTGECTLWRPVPPSIDYASVGHIATPWHRTSDRPDAASMVCFHKRFLSDTKVGKRVVLRQNMTLAIA